MLLLCERFMGDAFNCYLIFIKSSLLYSIIASENKNAKGVVPHELL